MQLLFDRARGPRSIHVLIIGVGEHDGGFPAPIPLMDATIRRLYRWWKEVAPERCLPGWRMGTIDVLASAPGGLALVPDGEHAGRAVRPPTRRNVEDAFAGWRDRLEPETMGFLHWSGHGSVVGQDSGAPMTSLYCSDLDGVRIEGIDWSATNQALNSIVAEGAQISCFVDSCRTLDSNGTRYRAAIGFDRPPRLRRAFSIHSAEAGDPAYATGGPIEATEFPGGPIGTHAMLDALDRFGADEIAPGQGYGANPWRIGEASRDRLNVIGALVPEPDTPPPAWPDMTFPHEPTKAILAIPAPSSMLQVSPPSGRSVDEFACEVMQVGSGEAARLAKGRKTFSTLVTYGEVDIRLTEQDRLTADGFHKRVPVSRCKTEIGMGA